MKKSKRYFAKRLYYKHHSMLVPKTRGDGTQEIDTKKIETELDRRVTTHSKDDTKSGDNQMILGSKRFADDVQLVDTVPLYTGYIPTDIEHSSGKHTVKTYGGLWPSLSMFTRNKLVTEDPTQTSGRESYSGMAVTTTEFSGLGEKKMLEKARAGLLFSSTKTDNGWDTGASLTTNNATIRIDSDSSIDLCRRSSFTTVPVDVEVETCSIGTLRIITLLIEATKEHSTLISRLFGEHFYDFTDTGVEHLPVPVQYTGFFKSPSSAIGTYISIFSSWIGQPISTWPDFIFSIIDRSRIQNTKTFFSELANALDKSKTQLYKALVYYTCFAILYIGSGYDVFTSSSSDKFWSSSVKYDEIVDLLLGVGSIQDAVTNETIHRNFPALRLLSKNDWRDIMNQVTAILDSTVLTEFFSMSQTALKETYVDPYLATNGLTGCTLVELYDHFVDKFELNATLMHNLKDSEYIKPTYIYTLAHLIERAEAHNSITSENLRGERWNLTFTALGTDYMETLSDATQQQKKNTLMYLVKTMLTESKQYRTTELGVTLNRAKKDTNTLSLSPMYNTSSKELVINSITLGECSNQFLSVYGRNLPIFSGHFKHGYYNDPSTNTDTIYFKCLSSSSTSTNRVYLNFPGTAVMNSWFNVTQSARFEIFPYLLNLPAINDNEVWNAEIRFTFPINNFANVYRVLEPTGDGNKVSDLKSSRLNLYRNLGTPYNDLFPETLARFGGTLTHTPNSISFLGYYGNRRFLDSSGNAYITETYPTAAFAVKYYTVWAPNTYMTLLDSLTVGSQHYYNSNQYTPEEAKQEVERDMESSELTHNNYFHVEITLINRTHKFERFSPGSWEAAIPMEDSVFPYFYLGGPSDTVPEKT